jgi:quercetin dioxygenase-like cupin family protein
MSRTRLAIVVMASSLAAAPAGLSGASHLGSTAISWEEIEARPSPNGRSRSILRAPTATLDELESHVTVLPPGQTSHPPHRHPEEEILILREGTLHVNMNGQSRRVGPGAFVFLASQEEHNVLNVGDTPAVYYIVQWRSPGAPKAAK